MTRPAVTYLDMWPWTPNKRRLVGAILTDLAPNDEAELLGLHPELERPIGLLDHIGAVMTRGQFLEGFIAVENAERAVAVGMAYRGAIPNVASLALFGRANAKRAMPAVYAELERRRACFGEAHNVRVAQVPVLTTYRAPMRRLERMGGEAAFHYGPIGPRDLPYTHMFWRF